MNPLKLLIVGAGRLGQRVGIKFPGEVTGETLTPSSHQELKKLGILPRIRIDEGDFDSVLFAVPPSSSNFSYLDEVNRALSLWNGTKSFVFVSSTSVYSEDNGGEVTENSLLSNSLRASTLLQAEDAVIKKNGTVLRLAGLYDESSGPQIYYSKIDHSELRGDGLINLIHYDDAASLALKLLEKKYPAQFFLGSDNSPLTRNELVSLSAQIIKSSSTCKFLGQQGPIGKRVNNSLTRKALGWIPQYPSFKDFVLGNPLKKDGI
jgi:nucleoside-diphosphate-sugar epimerase